jgi:hypothetical protein
MSSEPKGTEPNDPKPETVYDAAEEAALVAAAAVPEVSSLSIRDAQISFHFRRWWGFELHCNERALELIEGLRGALIDLISTVARLPPPVGLLIWVYMHNRQRRIQRASQGLGARLISPWIAPLQLTPRPLIDPPPPGHVPDPGPGPTALRWGILGTDRGQDDWSEPEVFRDIHSVSSPALAAYGDHLFCVHRGGNQDESLWWMSYDPGRETVPETATETGWSDSQRVNHNQASAFGPALATFTDQHHNERLYCVYRGHGTDTRLHWTTWDGNTWSQNMQLRDGSIRSAAAPALAVFRNRLYCSYPRLGDGQLMLTSLGWDGSTFGWSSPSYIGPATSTHNPALVVFRDSLFCLYLQNGIRSTQFDGDQWTPPVSMGRLPISDTGPAAVVLNDRLYCAYCFQQVMFLAVFDGNQWRGWLSEPGARGHFSVAEPGLVVFRDKHMQADHESQDQLMFMYRGPL